MYYYRNDYNDHQIFDLKAGMNKIRFRRFAGFLTGILILFFIFPAGAQLNDFRDILWYFGQSEYGIKFRKSDFNAELDSTQNPTFSIGGSAVASDPVNGDLLFYTDGNVVYDRSHQLISNYSPGLNGNTNGNQPVVVAALPSSDNQFLIVANSASRTSGGTIFSAIIDMNAQGNAPNPQEVPYGQMLSPANTNLTTNASEGMAMISNPAGTRTWLITHERNTASFLVTEVTMTGVDPGSTNSFDFAADGMPSLIAANISYSDAAGKIAVSPQDTSKNVHLIDFSNTNGTLSYDTAVLNSATFDIDPLITDNYSIYDTEWSPDGSKLYISRHGSDGQVGMVYQYDVNNSSVSLAEILSNPVHRSYGLKKGPDNIIYHLYQQNSGGPLQVGALLDADSVAGDVIYQRNAFGNMNFAGRQFPSTLPKTAPGFDNFGFSSYGVYLSSSTKFYPLTIPQADRYQWDFGDGTNSNLVAPIHNYEQPGSYTVRLNATVNGQDSTFVNPVIIQQCDSVVLRNDSGSELPTDTTICQDETLLLDASQPPANRYIWSDPDVTGSSMTVDTAGYYWVVAFYDSPSGECQSYDAINVNEYNHQLQVANQWYFGFQAGIDFNETPAVALTDGVMNAPEGCSAISDRNGQILFYTDGESVFGRSGQLLGEFIGGDQTASQSVLAIPFPQDETMYYIFTTREIYNSDQSYILSYSILDIKKESNGDPGDVVLQELPLYLKNTERIAAIGGYGNDALLVAHEYGNNTFRMYPVTANGIGNPVLRSIGSVHGFGSEESAEGYMKFSQDGSKLAVALSSGGNNYVDLFDFVDSTATISNHQLIEFDELYPQYQVYGVEFSPQANKLYVSLTGNTSRIYEIRLDSADINFINQTKNLLREENSELGALQTGPDGLIYVASNGSTVLPTINPNDDPLTPSIYNENGFDLQGRTSGLGFPNFIQNVGTGIGAPTASVSGFCVGQETTFNGQPSSSIDQTQWFVTRRGDSTRVFSDTQASTTHIFQQAGDYTVNFRVTNRCGLDTTITQDITIKDPPADPTIPENLAICTGNEVLEAAPEGTSGLTYLWDDGSTDRTLQVSSPGIYSVVISYVDTTLNGCTSTGETFASDGRPQFDLGPDLTVCQDQNVADLATGLNPTSYIFDWRINSSPSTVTGTSHPVDTSVPGTFSYTVNVEDNLTNCVANDTAVITVNTIPSLTYSVTNSTCGNNNGAVQISNQPPNTTVTLFDQNGGQVGLTNLAAGTYSLQVQSQISGCSQFYTINVIDADSPITINTNAVDGCESSSIEVQLSGETYPLDYLLTNISDGSTASGTINADDPDPSYTFNITGLSPGTYDLQITSGGCTDIEQDITLVQLPETVIDVQPVYTNCQTVVTVDPDPDNSHPNQTYFWNGPNANNVQARIFETSGQGTYTVRAEAPGRCATEETFEIILYERPIVEIGITGDGCGTPVTLTANIENVLPGTNYSYVWSDGTIGRVNEFDPPTSGDFITYSNISVEVQNQQNGCQGTDGPVDVTTYQDFSVFLTSSIACEDGEPVTITANILNISSANIDSYIWAGPEPGIENLDLQSINVLREGRYEVTAVWKTCEETTSINVSRSPVTDANIDPFYNICPEPPANETVIIDVNNFADYTMFNLTTDQQLVQFEPGRFEILEPGLYEGSGVNSFGCVTTDTFSVQIQCVPQLYAPNAFYPDSNIPENRFFSVEGVYIADDFQIIIFNKWGEPVFESTDKNFAWDGTKNGVLLPNGTYAYVIRFKSITDTDPRTYEQRGGVTLIR